MTRTRDVRTGPALAIYTGQELLPEFNVSDSDEALIKYALEVEKLLLLHRRVHERLDRCALQDFNLQFILVEGLTQIAKLPVIHVEPYTEGGK